ncbi:MAG: PKD domain-containing protein, partial [Gammaproteobacteria bacterium]|nr:PKD domain-containing protein [Gammaproteobacteria bacterium]
SFTDARGGTSYESVQIGNQCWMAENLRYSDAGSGEFWCYDDHYSNCEIYGVLYAWTTALWVCPDGWHLPSDNEWKILEGTVDSQYPVGDTEWDKGEYRGYRGFDAGEKLKSASGWTNNGNGTDLYGFGALSGGGRQKGGTPFIGKLSNSTYKGLGDSGFWWSSSEHLGRSAWTRNLDYDHDGSSRDKYYKADGYSVRCLKDTSAISADFYGIPMACVPQNHSESPTGYAPLTVKFYDRSTIVQISGSSVGINSWQWDFGDGNTSTQKNPEHTYQNAGSYTVGLTVTADVDYVGYDSEIKTNYIEAFTTTGVWGCGERFMDERDGKKYATVQI